MFLYQTLNKPKPILETRPVLEIPPPEFLPPPPAEIMPEILPEVPVCGPIQIGNVLVGREWHTKGIQSNTVSYPVKNSSNQVISGQVQITSFDHETKQIIGRKAVSFSLQPNESEFLSFLPQRYFPERRESMGLSKVWQPYDYQIDFVLVTGDVIAQLVEVL